MKVAISAFSNDLEGKVNQIFGRCQGFIIAKVEGGEIKTHEFIKNEAINSPSGAGVAASQQVINQKVDAIISGNLGPNAFMLLQQRGIKLYQVGDLTIKEAIKKMFEGTVEEINKPSAGSKFGMNK